MSEENKEIEVNEAAENIEVIENISDEVSEEKAELPKEKKKRQTTNPFKSKKFKHGGLSVLFSVIFIVAVILINVIINTLLDRYNVKLDLTENSLYTIEKSTTDYLKELTGNVEFIITNNESDFANMSIYYSQMNEIAKVFENANPSKISLSYVDLLTNPSFTGEYGGNLTTANIVVKSEVTGRYKVLTSSDYLSVKYYDSQGNTISDTDAQYYSYLGMQYYTDVSAAAEQAILSAIMAVTNDSPVRVAITTGFGESTESSGGTSDGLKTLLDKNSYIVETIDMNLSEIDEGVDYLIIYAPTSDYTVDVIQKIEKWLDNNGQYNKNVIYVAGLSTANMPVLDNFLAEWGIKVENQLIWQTNTNYAGGNNYNQYLQTNNNTAYDAGSGVLMGYYVRPITRLYEADGSFETLPIIQSYDGAVGVPFEPPEDYNPANEPQGVLYAGIETTKVRFIDNKAHISRVISFGSPLLFDTYFLEAEQVANAELLINMFNTISGKEEGVKITPKSFHMSTFSITAGQANLIAVVFVIILPVLIFALGIFVWMRRRYL